MKLPTKTFGVLVLLLVSMTLGLFWPATGYELVNLDDLSYVTENQLVRQGLNWPAIHAAVTSVYQEMWAPGLWISYMLDTRLYGTTAGGLHFTNILLHALNAGLFFLLLYRWTHKPWRAFWAVAIWAWHPLRVESVAWVSARKDVLSGLFFLACLLFYDLAHRGRIKHASLELTSQSAAPPRMVLKRICLFASMLALFLGLTVKPMLVATPVVLLLLDIWPLGRVRPDFRDLLRKLPRLVFEKCLFWLLVACSAFMAIYAHAQESSIGHVPLMERLKTIPLNYAFYLLKTFRPRHLTVLYDNLAFQPLDFGLAAFLLVAPMLWAWKRRERALSPLIGWLWFLGAMLPTSGIIRFGAQSLADRFTYLPAMGLSIMVLSLFSTRGLILRRIRFVLCVGILLALAGLTARQLPVWRDSEHLYDNLLRRTPEHAFALSEKATQMNRRGKLQEAENLIVRACRSPSHSDTQQIMMAEILASGGKPEQAKAHLLSLTLETPGSSTGIWHFALAMVLNQLHKYPEALTHARQAVDTLPPHDLLYRDLLLLGMTISFRMDDPAEALEWAHRLPQLRNTSHVQFGDLMPYYVGQWKRFQRLEALGYFREYLDRNPDQIEALNNLVWLMATSEWSPLPAQEIVDYAQRAHTLAPSNPIVLDTLGVALAHAGEFAAAQDIAGQALDILRAAGQEQSVLFQRISRRMAAYRSQSPWREENAADRMLGDYYGD